MLINMAAPPDSPAALASIFRVSCAGDGGDECMLEGSGSRDGSEAKRTVLVRM